jgi:hypothetical protein
LDSDTRAGADLQRLADARLDGLVAAHLLATHGPRFASGGRGKANNYKVVAWAWAAAGVGAGAGLFTNSRMHASVGYSACIIIERWIVARKLRPAPLHGCCAGCWSAWRFIRHTAICAMNYFSAVLRRSTPPIIRFPLRTTSATACAPAVCFKGFRR